MSFSLLSKMGRLLLLWTDIHQTSECRMKCVQCWEETNFHFQLGRVYVRTYYDQYTHCLPVGTLYGRSLTMQMTYFFLYPRNLGISFCSSCAVPLTRPPILPQITQGDFFNVGRTKTLGMIDQRFCMIFLLSLGDLTVTLFIVQGLERIGLQTFQNSFSPIRSRN